MVFGAGPHRCLGEALTIVELEEALTARLPNLQLVGDPPTVYGATGIRKVQPMRVRWSP